MSGPYTSASSRPMLRPLSARARARLRLTVDLPTPPFPLATATTFMGSRGTHGETVDDIAQDCRVRVDLGEPPTCAFRGLVGEAPGALRAVLAHVAVRVEDVVHDLEQEPELLCERAPWRLLLLRQLRRPERHRDRRVEEAPRLQPVYGSKVVAVDHRVEVLAADHPERRLGELPRDGRGLVARREPHGLREQRVARKHADALAELLPG